MAFGQTLHDRFLNYDDNDYVYDNPKIAGGLTTDGIKWAFTHFHADNWHPLTTISHMLDCQLYGLQPWGHHLTNTLLHATAAILLFLAVRALTSGSGRASNLWPSAFVAALFAIHPQRVESVAWISERKDVLSGVFFALTLWAYACYAREDRHRVRHYIEVVVFFALGLMCKPTLVTVPFALLLLDYWPLERMQGAKSKEQGIDWQAVRGLVVEKIPLFALSAASCVVTLTAQKSALSAIEHVPVQMRFSNAIVSYVIYLWQTVWPARLAVLYPYPENRFEPTLLLLALVLLWAVSITTFVCRRRYPFLLVGWLWFVGMLVPMIGLVQVGSQSRADRYTYLPAIGLYILVAWGTVSLAAKWSPVSTVLKPLAFLVIVLLAARSYFQTQYWRDSEALWRRAVEVISQNYAGENSLANALFDKGQLDDAIAHYRAALAIKPTYPPIHSNLGNALLRQDHVDEAIFHLKQAIRVNPTYAEAYNNLASAFMKKGQFAEAISDYEKAIQFKPNYAEAYNNLGVAHLQQGNVDAAIVQYKKAVEINPASADLQFNLGNAYARKLDWDSAVIAYETAIRARPDSPKIHNNLGVAFKALGKIDLALEQFTDAVGLNPDYPEAHCNLGSIFAQQGRRDEAITHLSEAVRLKPDYTEAQSELAAIQSKR